MTATRPLSEPLTSEYSPPDEILSVALTTSADGACLILRGEVDVSTVSELRAAIARALDAHPCVEVDMAEVSFLDSSGITALISGYKRADGLGGGFRVTRPSSQVQRVLSLVGQLERFVG
jgi:anti-sigma B factor antagonist